MWETRVSIAIFLGGWWRGRGAFANIKACLFGYLLVIWLTGQSSVHMLVRRVYKSDF
jgi:hypothetical protein